MSESVDVLVVGGGSTGWAAAGAFAEAGRSVIVVEKREGSGGARWINGVPVWCFEDARLAPPEAPERWGGEGVHGFVMQAAVGSRRLRLEAPPTLHVDMRHLVERLRAGALEAGARRIDGTVESVATRDGRVTEVSIARSGGRASVRPRLAVDASGLAGALRRRVPELASHCPDVGREDICSAAQFQHRVEDPEAGRAYLARHGAEPGDSLGLLGGEGGYSTLTLFTEPSMKEIGVLTGSIPATGAASGPAMLKRFVEAQPWIGERLYGGQGSIPLRRPYSTLGLSGVALIGDAACQVYSSHGSGVGMGLLAARTLADAASRLDDPGGDEALGAYQRSFHRRYGGLLAGADAFRRLSQRLTGDDIAELLNAGLLDARLMRTALDQRIPEIEARWLAGAMRRALARPRVAGRLLPTLARMTLLQSVAGYAPGGHRGVAGGAFERAVRALVGRTPRPAR